MKKNIHRQILTWKFLISETIFMDFLNRTNISYVTKIITNASELNDNLLEELKKTFEEEAIDVPFLMTVIMT